MGSVAPIVIDGPVASGKTAVGRLVAQELGCRFLDTGIMYRALTWAAMEGKVSLKDHASLVRLARERVMEVVFHKGGEVSILLDQKDVTPYLWRGGVEDGVSEVSKVAGVREVLVAQQRSIASGGPLVMAGRDIGTVVLPNAPVKVFLTASVAERARRRHAELHAMGRDLPNQQVMEDLEQRDRLDSEREIGPLRPARDAYVIDTDNRSVEEVAEMILRAVRQR